MKHVKFQDHTTLGSAEECTLNILPYMGMAAILVMRIGPSIQTFVLLSHEGFMLNLTLIG